MSCFQHPKRNGLLSIGVGVFLALAAAPISAWSQDLDPNTPVSSDGVVGSLAGSAESATETMIPAFKGMAREAAALDTLSSIPNRAETVEEVWDLWAATPLHGSDGGEAIFLPDNRVRVNPTTTFPARAVALITFNNGFGLARCSGFLIGPNTVVTTGHCVNRGRGRGFFNPASYLVYPGRNGAASPFGACTARTLFTVAGWSINGNEQFDYGAIKLNCNVGNLTGWFGLLAPANPTGLISIMNGYPGDKPLTQWRSNDRVRVSTARQIFYLNDTLPGNSGSPVYQNVAGCGFCAFGFDAYNPHGATFPHNSFNHGTRITLQVLNNLLAWRNAP